MSKSELNFRISSALKSIVGSDLIPDDYIAVFELVKNSYDAYATRVDVIFENIDSENAKIIIKDNGKGMSYDDLINKWLFLAYSAKREGTEEDSYDYRDKIEIKRAYAGAKGIGRFSCDKLGSELYLETIKDEENPKVETLLTDWDKFEGSMQDEFINVTVLHETISESNYNLKHGTVLEITRLKSIWDRDKLLKLKQSLAKLINPHENIKDDQFKIFLNVESEKENDIDKPYNERVNGQIENLIFDTLDFKTSKITSTVTKDEITTILYEAGQQVYEIIEKNPFSDLLNVNLELYYLNRSAKLTFKRRMGVDLLNYGHIFLYKNGVRIYPYGEKGEDPFKLDIRKTQGYNRYIGNREALGFISIYDTENLKNSELRETTSRGDGMIQTKAYEQLQNWLLITLRRLERFVVDIVNWGNELNENEFIKLSELERKEELKNLVESLTRSKEILSFTLSPDIIKILDEKSVDTVENKLSKIAKQVKDGEFEPEELAEDLRNELKRLDNLKKISTEAQEEAFEKSRENVKISGQLEREKKKGAFQGALIGSDKERIVSLQHQVFHSSSRIHRNIKLLLKHLGKEEIEPKTQKHIFIISKEASKINSIARFITKANFNLTATEINQDLVEFIEGYLNEMYIFKDAIIDTKMKVAVQTNAISHKIIFRPLDITTMIDVFISNSEKSNASKIEFSFSKQQNKLVLIVSDNGSGIADNHLDSIFDLGFTTTNGSGIGLYLVKETITKSLKGDISVKSDKKTTTFKIII